jgi:hypothetical protein
VRGSIKMLKGELENNSINPENWHSDGQKKVQLTLSQCKKKKRDEVEGEDYDDVERNNVSNNRVTMTQCKEE